MHAVTISVEAHAPVSVALIIGLSTLNGLGAERYRQAATSFQMAMVCAFQGKAGGAIRLVRSLYRLTRVHTVVSSSVLLSS